jgi:hypothetical protein
MSEKVNELKRYELVGGGWVKFTEAEVKSIFPCQCGRCGNTIVILENGKEFHLKGEVILNG